MNSLLYPGLIEELVDIVELKDNTFVVSFHSFYMISVRFELYVSNRCLFPFFPTQEIKAASLRTLTSIIHLERNPKYVDFYLLQLVIYSTYE